MADNSLRTPGVGETIASDDIGGVKHQRVKLEIGVDGVASDVVRAADRDGSAVNDGILANSELMWDGAAYRQKRSASGVGTDAVSGTVLPPAAGYVWNGATWDRERGNEERTLLASAARTVSTSSPTQTNYNARGALITIDVTAGTGISLTPSIIGYTTSGQWASLAAGTVITTATYWHYLIYPGTGAVNVNGSNFDKVSPFPLPRTWLVYLQHNNANSVTYSVTASLIV